MKFIDINREFTAAANSYMAQGYYINAGTMGGSQGEVAHIDLTNGTEIIRCCSPHLTTTLAPRVWS